MFHSKIMDRFYSGVFAITVPHREFSAVTSNKYSKTVKTAENKEQSRQMTSDCIFFNVVYLGESRLRTLRKANRKNIARVYEKKGHGYMFPIIKFIYTCQ